MLSGGGGGGGWRWWVAVVGGGVLSGATDHLQHSSRDWTGLGLAGLGLDSLGLAWLDVEATGRLHSSCDIRHAHSRQIGSHGRQAVSGRLSLCHAMPLHHVVQLYLPGGGADR